MNIEPVILDEAAAAKLAAANGHSIPLQGSDGGVVAFGVSPERLAKLERLQEERLAEIRRDWPDDEFARMKDEHERDTSPRIPHEEVMRWIESL